MNVLQKFEQKNIAEIEAGREASKFEDFNVGDTINVGVKIADVAGFRTQYYEGVCIAKSNKSHLFLDSLSHLLFSAIIDSIIIK